MTVRPSGETDAENDEGTALSVRPFIGRSYMLQDCTIRSDGDGRTVEAYAAAFNAPSEIRDQEGHYLEVISPGAFNKTIADNGTRFGVFYNHGMSIHGTPDGALSVPIGVPIEAPRADEHGIYTVTRYLDNPLADSVLDAVRQRAITGQSFSGRFMRSTREKAARGGLATITRREVAMREYGPTPFPAYAAAHIVGTRSADAFLRDLLALDAEERAELFAQMTALITRNSEPVSAPPTTPETGAGPAVEPQQPHSPRHEEVTRRARAARILREAKP